MNFSHVCFRIYFGYQSYEYLLIFQKKYANCTDVERRRYQMELEDSSESRRSYEIDLGRHLRDPDDFTARRSASTGGFCEVLN